ncbi:MAG: acetylornithine/succinylornithine family transaminase [Clostridia bacterium]|nr:acetylornithine/succinylornithine family transaminase [Clostridia bacterium]
MSDLKAKDTAYVAGTYKRFPVEIVSGKGSLVYDETGKEYVDMGSGIGVTAFGIADDEWIAAVTAQLGKVQHMSNLYYTEPCAHLAEMLCNRTGMKKVFFSNSGAEANEAAIKVARKYAAAKNEGRSTIVTLVNSFHGRTLTTLAATGQDHYHELYQPLTPGFRHIAAGDLDELREAITSPETAALLIECVQGEGGVIALDPAYVREAERLCKENDVLLMVDEVQTGNGRTGTLYAYMQFGVMPDVVSTAKGIGGGLPLGACLLGEKVENVFSYGDHGSTFGGNPVACAGAISVIGRLDEPFLAAVREKASYIRETLTGAAGIEGVSGMGLMVGIKTTAPAADVVRECMARGVLCLTAKDKVRLLPALNINMETLTRAVETIKAVAADLSKGDTQ